MRSIKRIKRNTPRILIVNDHQAVLNSLSRLLRPHFTVVGTCLHWDGLLQAVENLQPNTILLDISMPDRNGLDIARELRKFYPQIDLIIVSMHSQPFMIEEALKIGVSGYVLKSRAGADLIPAIEAIRKGSTYYPVGYAVR